MYNSRLLYEGKCLATGQSCKESSTSVAGACRTCKVYQNFFYGIEMMMQQEARQSELELAVRN